ncbi:MAG TPA: DUF222 domain-containing protein [Mycobacteriales bacterium]|nr:DUF222 domain-containing protein [Mycobacteriales bacterium]
MFDPIPFDAADDAYYARQAAQLDLIDEQDVLGWEPQVPPAPDDAELCADAADHRRPVAPALLSRLDVVDIDTLDGAAAVDAAAAWDRVANRAAARRVQTIARAALHHVGTERIDPIRLAAAELGAVLRLGSGSIDAEIDVALALTTRLQRTLALMEAGDVSYGKGKCWRTRPPTCSTNRPGPSRLSSSAKRASGPGRSTPQPFAGQWCGSIRRRPSVDVRTPIGPAG